MTLFSTITMIITSVFQTLGRRQIHKEIKLQKDMNVMDIILCKTDHILIRRFT